MSWRDNRIVRDIVLNSNAGFYSFVRPPTPTASSVMPTGPFTREVQDNQALLALHIKQVAEESKQIKKNGEHVTQVEEYRPYQGGYLTRIIHGIVGPTKVTSIVTTPKGKKQVNVGRL